LSQQVSTRFYRSPFIECTRAEEMPEEFERSIGQLDLRKMVHFSMFVPNVNWKLHRLLQQKLCNESCASLELLDIERCGLHVVHESFSAGHTETKWNIYGLLRNMHCLLKDSPVRALSSKNSLDAFYSQKNYVLFDGWKTQSSLNEH
jgi:hypothetical protein